VIGGQALSFASLSQHNTTVADVGDVEKVIDEVR
jgi:hypothetical protein